MWDWETASEIVYVLHQVNSQEYMRLRDDGNWTMVESVIQATKYANQDDARWAMETFMDWLEERNRTKPIYNGEPYSSARGGLNVVQAVTLTYQHSPAQASPFANVDAEQ